MELSTRRMQPNETVRDVYADIDRLIPLAFPDDRNNPSIRKLGIDYFLAALDNPELRRHVKLQQPQTMEKTLLLVTQFLAYPIPPKVEPSTSGTEISVSVLAAPKATALDPSEQFNQMSLLHKEIREMRSQLDAVQQTANAQRSNHKPSFRKEDSSKERSDSAERSTPTSPQPYKNKKQPCNICKQAGHWWRECAQRRNFENGDVRLPYQTKGLPPAGSSTSATSTGGARDKRDRFIDTAAININVDIQLEIAVPTGYWRSAAIALIWPVA
jgi:hypothetical protein